MKICIKKRIPNMRDFNFLYEQSGWGKIRFRIYARIRYISSFAVSVYDGKKIIGMGRAAGDGLHYTIYDVTVLNDYQGKGIGSIIMNTILDWFDALPDHPHLNLGSVKGKEGFYEKFGFKCRPYGELVGAGMKYVGRLI